MVERYQEWIRFSFVASGRYLLKVREIGRIVRVCYPDAIPDNTPQMSAQSLVTRRGGDFGTVPFETQPSVAPRVFARLCRLAVVLASSIFLRPPAV